MTPHTTPEHNLKNILKNILGYPARPRQPQGRARASVLVRGRGDVSAGRCPYPHVEEVRDGDRSSAEG
jgi:hypothetical protein